MLFPASELAARHQSRSEAPASAREEDHGERILKKLWRLVGKKWIAHASLLPGTTIKGGEPSPLVYRVRSYPFMFIENLVGEMAGSIANAMTTSALFARIMGALAELPSMVIGESGRCYDVSQRPNDCPVVNAKRVYRVMRDHGLLLERKPAVPWLQQAHKGRVAVNESNRRWCSDGFEFRCDNGEKLRVTFAMDCCDREALDWAASTGVTTVTRYKMSCCARSSVASGMRCRPHRWNG